MADLQPIIENLKGVLLTTKEKIDDNGGFDKTDFLDVYNGLVLLVSNVENASGGALSGIEKRTIAVEIASWMCDIPWVPKGIERAIFGIFIELAFQGWKRAKASPAPE